MFTGIIETLGTVTRVEPLGGDLRLTVEAPKLAWHQVNLGDSIATNGVCLTVIAKLPQGFSADVSRESLSLTTIESWQAGKRVNLEQALQAQSRLGGHMVSGHVDGVGEVVARHGDGRSERFQIKAPAALARYLAHKGSVAVDGISLTINAVAGSMFDLNIVPHTLKHTIMDGYQVGSRVNLEVDVIARYLERLLLGDKASDAEADTGQTGITAEFLAQHGFNR